jgi:AcrR family transcriptional regulator
MLMGSRKTVMEASSDRFVRAVQGHWETQGSAALSARRISVLADAPVSSIYHHFGSLEQLFATSQQASLARAKGWLADSLTQVTGLPRGFDAFPGFFAEIIDEWAHAQRSLAFAWRECQLLAESNALFRPLSAEWDELWRGFWREAGTRFALGAGMPIAYRVFENESFLHMIRWRRLVDRAALDETARVLGAWLSRRPVPETPWRDFARAEAMRAMPDLPQRDETAARIVKAAAELISDAGVARLTHRAVADRAGLTLGTVSHKFATKSALLEAGFEGLYEANLNRLQGGPVSLSSPNRESVLAAIGGMILRGASVRGSDELFVAVARDPSLSQFGLQLRYLRGRTSMGTLQTLVGEERVITPAEAALFSSFTTSQIRSFAGAGTSFAEDSVRREIEALLDILR